MQSYPLQIAGNAPVNISSDADLFVYESGAILPRTNLLKNSEGPVATLSSATNVVDGPGIDGFSNAIAVGDNTVVSRSAYRAFTPVTGKRYTISVYVKMDDSSVPKVGGSLSDDFMLVADVTIPANLISVEATDKPNVYRVSGTYVGGTATSKGFGVYKYQTQTVKTFQVTGFQLEEGDLTPYIKNATNGPLTVATGDTRIYVKPDNGSEIALKPGQRVRVKREPGAQPISRWYVRAYDGASYIRGIAVIGGGEFADDVNTLVITNTRDTPVIMAPDGAYTGTWNNKNGTSYGNPFPIVAASANVRGVVVKRIILTSDTNRDFFIVAKTTVPVGAISGVPDGDLLAFAPHATNEGHTVVVDQDIFVPPGIGVWAHVNNGIGPGTEQPCMVIYKVL